MTNADQKPLGRKSYGSIPHLPSSRIGPGDHYCHIGQQVILTEKIRDRHDRIIVTEKLDGANVSIARHEGHIIALGRAGHLAQTSPYEHIQHFAVWVHENEDRFGELCDGERLCGEWVSMAHGTLYRSIDVPFVPFDLMVGEKRKPTDEMVDLALRCYLEPAHVISDGDPVSIEQAMSLLGDSGFYGAEDGPEGAVWRCESRGGFNFIAKFVRHDKQDGKYLPGIGATEPIWFWRPAKHRSVDE